MRHIIIGNVDNEFMVGDVEKMSRAMMAGSSTVANRLAWLANQGDILVLPYLIPAELMRLIGATRGVDLSACHIIVPPSVSDWAYPLTGDRLLSAPVIASIRAAMGGYAGPWRLVPYFYTSSVAELARELGIEAAGNAGKFLAQGGAELLNQKTVFRKIAAGAGVPHAEGEVATSAEHLCRIAERLIRVCGSVILKQDRNAGGDGNFVLTVADAVSHPGASDAFKVEAVAGGVADIVKSLSTRLFGVRNEQVIVEVYHAAQQVLYSEFWVSPGEAARYLNHGVMRMEPLWIGFEIPGELTPGIAARFLAHSTRFAQRAADLGFQGLINLDALVDNDGKIIFTECNGRAGGCTHVHALSEELVGLDYLDKRVVLTRNKVRGPGPERATMLLRELGLAFSDQTKEGCLLLNFDEDLEQMFEVMVVARDYASAISMERRFLNAMDEQS